MKPQRQDASIQSSAAAIVAVAAVYVYFLIFAQFGFLKAVQDALGREAGAIRPVMGTMGLAGIVGSVFAAWRFAASGGRRLLGGGLAICALAAAGSLVARRTLEFQGCALLVGLGTGIATVALAALLRPSVGREYLGRVVGFGTGLAYAFCNVPAVFEAGAATQAWIALLAVAAGWIATAALTPTGEEELPIAGDYARHGAGAWGLIFFALVSLDSAAFFVIQQTPALKAGLWGGPVQLALNAGVHLVAAVLAGWALDRGALTRTAVVGAGLLLLACGLLLGGGAPPFVAAGYVAGVSVYSVALVYYPANSGRAGLAAIVYITAGWIGSGLGIGLMEGRDRLPRWLPATAAIILLICLGDRILARRHNKE